MVPAMKPIWHSQTKPTNQPQSLLMKIMYLGKRQFYQIQKQNLEVNHDRPTERQTHPLQRGPTLGNSMTVFQHWMFIPLRLVVGILRWHFVPCFRGETLFSPKSSSKITCKTKNFKKLLGGYYIISSWYPQCPWLNLGDCRLENHYMINIDGISHGNIIKLASK